MFGKAWGTIMQAYLVGSPLLAIVLLSCPLAGADSSVAIYGRGTHKITVATGSPGEVGLLEALANAFNRTHDSTVCWRRAGSGESLELLRQKQVDVVLVHAPEAERKAVEQGWGACRTLIGANEFYLVGPKKDPAGVSSTTSVVDAYTRIARTQSTFLSRGDNSGTHQKELSLWEQAGIQTQGSWYVVTHDFMLETLKKADELQAYFMTDSSTWVIGKRGLPNLVVLLKGDPSLINIYHGLCQPDDAPAARRAESSFSSLSHRRKGRESFASSARTNTVNRCTAMPDRYNGLPSESAQRRGNS